MFITALIDKGRMGTPEQETYRERQTVILYTTEQEKRLSNMNI